METVKQLKHELLKKCEGRMICVEQLPQEEITAVCQNFSSTTINELILMEIPYPSKDPNNDLCYKLRIALQKLNWAALTGG